jgi:SAM-dependent methyltransferase
MNNQDTATKISSRARSYLLFLRWFSWSPERPKALSLAARRLESLWQAVWLGWLDADDLNGITWSHYMGTSGFEAEPFNVHQGLWPWEADASQRHFKDCKRVLVAGAGGGREVIALARLGHQVTAFDFSRSLTAACSSNLEKAGCSAVVLDAPPDGLPADLGIHDAVLIGRGFYHHIPGRMRRVAFLQSCRACVAVGAPVILSDFFTRSAGSRFHRRTRQIANVVRRLRGEGEGAELGDWLTNCMQHAFTREEIEQELVDAGFCLETYTVSPFSEESHLALAVGRAT